MAKSRVPFTAFCADHGIEQGNQALKVFGEIKGTLSGLRQFFTTESPLKMMKKSFYFTLKSLFVLKILKLLF